MNCFQCCSSVFLFFGNSRLFAYLQNVAFCSKCKNNDLWSYLMRNLKKTLSFLLSTVIIVSSVAGVGTTVFAATGEHTYKNFKYRILDDNTAEICGYTGKNAVVTVPDCIDSKPVTSIGRTAFYSGKIKEVTIPNTVKNIKWWAFYGCESLEKINLNFGLKTVGYGAFMNCKNLKSVSIPMSVTQICDDSFAVSCSTKKGVFDTYSKQTISTQQYSTDSLFTLEGYSGTVAEKYCNDNSLNFVSLGNVIYGDVNNNGTVDAADAKLAKSLIDTVPTEEELTAADVDDDGKITENDVNLILQAVGNEFYAQLFPCAKAMYSAPDYLSGRTMYCDGDSVAYGSGTNTMGNSTYSFCNYVAEKYNMTMTNKATPGTTLAIRKDFIGTDHRSILERVREMKGSYDVILLDGGFNDLFKNVEMGAMTDINNKSGKYNEYTTAGALESICYFLDKNYKDSIKLFVLCHNCSTRIKQSQYWSLMKNILDKWEIPYVDLSEETELTGDNEEITTQYFRYNATTKKGDGIHPLAYANMKIYGPIVAEKLNETVQSKSELVLPKSDISMGLFESYTLNSEITELRGDIDVSYSSSNPSVASVDENGNIVATGIGDTVITISTSDGKTKNVNVNVKFLAMAVSFGKNKISLSEGNSSLLNLSVADGEATCSTTYSSTDPTVASVDENSGKITANKTGKTTVSCTTANGVTVRCLVYVTSSAQTEMQKA
ncbi:hypothetical protein DW063_02700 [Ruminococcus sp. AF43-11]|nr:hypothetical protein DW063_02700 [Ruminococcus sp. AF43-11]